jgi:glycosidase
VLGVGAVLTMMGVPCVYSGTEQGFDGGGDSDVYIREAMFGGNWGAFDTTGVHFFNDQHPIYQGLARIARVRAAEPALRYGRQYFRDISGDGEHFGTPTAGKTTLAYSRVLDSEEILVAMNVDTQARADWVLVDPALTTPGTRMRDLLAPEKTYEVVRSGANTAVRVPLEPRTLCILKKA